MNKGAKIIQLQGEKIRPSKIIYIGRNHAESHVSTGTELQSSMSFFVKPNSVIGTKLSTTQSVPTYFESGISFLVQEERFSAAAFSLGLSTKELSRAHTTTFDGMALFGDFIPLGQKWHELRLELRINHKITQRGGVELMLHKPFEILEEAQSFMSLNDGDIVMTGTSNGVEKLERNRLYEGSLFNANELLVENQWIAN